MLVAAQLGTAGVVILAATLFARSFSGTLAYSPGFDTAHTAVAQFDASLQGFDDARGRGVQARVLDAAVHAPGVTRLAPWRAAYPMVVKGPGCTS